MESDSEPLRPFQKKTACSAPGSSFYIPSSILPTNIFPNYHVSSSKNRTQVADDRSTSLSEGNPKTPDPVGKDYNKKLLISFANIRGAYSNLLPTQHFLLLNNPAVLALCETFLTDSSATPDYPGYDVIRSDRMLSPTGKRIHGGGLLVLIRQDLPHKIISKSSTVDFEVVTFSVTLGNRSLIITSVYRPPSASTQVFDYLIQHHQQLQDVGAWG